MPASAISKICVFCGSRMGDDPRFAEVARQLGAALAERSLELVYGGAAVGTMGVLADSVLRGGGTVTGVIPSHLEDREVAHPGLSRLEVVADMAVRKDRMIELADAFVTLPGGLGTLDELFEVATGRQLSLHEKPFVLLDVGDFFAPLYDMLAQLVRAGFVDPAHGDLFLRATSVDEALSLVGAQKI